MPGVLNVDAGDVAAQGFLLLGALLEAALETKKEVKVGVAESAAAIGAGTGVHTGSGEVAIGVEAGAEVELVADEFGTDDDAVVPAHESEFVGGVEGVVVDDGGDACSAAGGELVGDGVVETGGGVLVDVDAEGGGVRSIGGIAAVIADAGESNVRGVDGAGADGPVFAEGERLESLEVAGLRGDQDVGGVVDSGLLVAVDEVATEEIVLGADVPVDARDELIVAGDGGNGVDVRAARLVRGRGKELIDGEGGRVPGGSGGVLVARDVVSGEWVFELNGGRAAGIAAADWVGDGEIAKEIGSGGKVDGRGRRGLLGHQALVAGEAEELVATDGAAEGAAELVLMERIGRGGVEVARVDVVVADELEDVAVVLVGAGAGDGVDQAAGVDAVLSAEHGGLDGELAERIREGERQVDVGHVVIVVAAIETPDGGVSLTAGDGNGDGLVAVLGAGEVAARRRGGTTSEVDQPGDLARGRVEGELRDLLLVDGLLELWVLSLESETFGLDGHAFRRLHRRAAARRRRCWNRPRGRYGSSRMS